MDEPSTDLEARARFAAIVRAKREQERKAHLAASLTEGSGKELQLLAHAVARMLRISTGLIVNSRWVDHPMVPVAEVCVAEGGTRMCFWVTREFSREISFHLLGTCPDCAGEHVPVYQVASLADVGDVLAGVWSLRSYLGVGCTGHQDSCPCAPKEDGI